MTQQTHDSIEPAAAAFQPLQCFDAAAIRSVWDEAGSYTGEPPASTEKFKESFVYEEKPAGDGHCPVFE